MQNPRTLPTDSRWSLETAKHLLSARFASLYRVLLRHAFPLLVVGLAAAIGQTATLIQPPVAYFTNDTPGYVDLAQHITDLPGGIIGYERTPGYPLFIAIVLGIAFHGAVNYGPLLSCHLNGQLGICATDLNVVVFAQAVVAILTLLECYILIYRISNRRVTACIGASLLALNLYIGAWERMVTSEFLSYWSLVTALLFFQALTRRPTVPRGCLFGAVCFVSIMIRPYNLFLPMVLLGLLALHQLRRGRVASQWKAFAAAGATLSIMMACYMAISSQVAGEFMPTGPGNINEFGKVMEYHIVDLPVDPQYAALQSQVVAVVNSGKIDPFEYKQAYGTSDERFTKEAAFARQIILRYPVIYLKKSIPDLLHTWTTTGYFHPAMGLPHDGVSPTSDTGFNWGYLGYNYIPGYTAYPRVTADNIPWTYEPFWVNLLLVLSTLTENAYLVLPLLLVALVAYMWRNPRSDGGFVLLCMSLVVSASIIVAGLLGYMDYYRYRFPVDWAMIVLVTISLIEAFNALALRRSTREVSIEPGISGYQQLNDLPTPTFNQSSLGEAETDKLPAYTLRGRVQKPGHEYVRFEPSLYAPFPERPEISVVLPCLNEEEAIGGCIDILQSIIARKHLSAEIVVVDNASTDRSAEIARAHGARVVYQPVRGYGNAYLKGFAEAHGTYIVMADADNTYDLSEINDFVQPLREGYDLVMGNRFAGRMAKGAMTFSHRYIGNPILSGILRLFFHTTVRDAHCGMRAFTRSAYLRMRLRTGGMEFASEMVINAAKARLKITERPISYAPRIGESKLHTLRDGWRHLRFMLLYSPTHLFLVPGVLFLLLGLGVEAVLTPGPLPLFGHNWDIHTMLLASVLALLGVQIVMLGLFARFFSLTEELDGEHDQVLQIVTRWFTLEWGLAIGGVVFALGFAADAFVLGSWIASGMGQLALIRPTVIGSTFLAIGAEIIFGSFFLSFLQFRKTLHNPAAQLEEAVSVPVSEPAAIPRYRV